MPDPPVPVDRRAFFRRLLLHGLNKAEDAGQRVANRFGLPWLLEEGHALAPRSDSGPGAPGDSRGALPTRFLRPPGACDEVDFRLTCSGCSACVEACPAQCIKIEPVPDEALVDGPGAPPWGLGLPFIIARQSPCVVCDDLSCMKVCPTDALTLVASPRDIDMGTAVMDFQRCLRGESGEGEECQLCIRDCPQGDEALGLGEDGRIEVRSGCIGCGVCERVCPTEPASIVVEPVNG